MNALDPLAVRDWNYETVAHLLNRAGFGGTPDEVETLRREGLTAAVHRLTEPTAPAESVSAPDWAKPQNLQQYRMEMRAAKKEGGNAAKKEKKEFRQMQGEDLLDLRRWWLERMATTPAPLLEKMTLFWHGHFATSASKVKNAYWLWQQNEIFRQHALGNFVTLTKEVSRNPAMMIYLDLQQNQQERPNENWARELMELFTVGIGNYSEDDIRESARAFTGYRVDMTNQQFRFAPRQHDEGPKTFMSKTGNWNGDDVIDLLSKQPACARFIAKKLWRFFVEDEPPDRMVEALAERIRAHGYEMRPVLSEMFSSAAFYAPAVRRNQIKSPVQFLIQTAKLLGTDLPAPSVTQNALRQMGQVVFAPPNVKGWDGGKAWVSTSTLLFRYNFANYLINGDAMRPGDGASGKKGADLAFGRAAARAEVPPRAPVNVGAIIPENIRDKPEEVILALSRRFYGAPSAAKEHAAFVHFLAERRTNTSDQTIRELMHLMMSTPQYQLT